MWWTHSPKLTMAIADQRGGDERVGDDAPPDVHGDHRRDHAGAGSSMMYTSGCPKIQNRCCHSSGLPPAAAS
jgi:hypothetical protein